MHNTEDKSWWVQHGLKLEREFIVKCNQLGIDAKMHPNKENNKYHADLLVQNRISDLKCQSTPFFTAARYGFDPQYTVTLNEKDLTRYQRLYPNILIFFWARWSAMEQYNTKVNKMEMICVQSLNWFLKHAKTSHSYQRRIDDRKGNAKNSFLFDLREMKQIYPISGD